MIGKTVSTGEGFVPADQLQKVDDVSNLLDSSLMETMVAVSYTHLTLPTILLV